MKDMKHNKQPSWCQRLIRFIYREWIFEQASSAEDESIEAYAKGNWQYGFEQKRKSDELYEKWHRLRREHGITSV